MQFSIVLVCLMPVITQALFFGSKTTHSPVTTTTSPYALAALVRTNTSPSTTAFPSHSGSTSAFSSLPFNEQCASVTYGSDPNNRYCGSFLSKRRNGLGIRVFGDGSKYLGEYRLDGVTGFGYWQEKSSTGGGQYLGDISNKLKEGNGYFRWPNGDSYTGGWFGNRMHGEGVFWSKNKKEVYIGSFANGVKSGRGTIISTDGNVLYKGFFLNDHAVKH